MTETKRLNKKTAILISIITILLLMIQMPIFSTYVGGDNTLLYFIDPDLFLNNFTGRSFYNNELVGIGRPFPQGYLTQYFSLIKILNVLSVNAQLILNAIYLLSILLLISIFYNGENNNKYLLLFLSIIPLYKTGIEHQSLSLMVMPLVLIYLIGFNLYINRQFAMAAILLLIFSQLVMSMLLVVNYFIPVIIFYLILTDNKKKYVFYGSITLFVCIIVNLDLVLKFLEIINIKNGYLPDVNSVKRVSYIYGEFPNFLMAFFGSIPVDYVRGWFNKFTIVIYVVLNGIIMSLLLIKYRLKNIDVKILIIHIICCVLYANWFIIDISVYIEKVGHFIPIISMWKNSTDKFAFLVMNSFVAFYASLFKLRFKC